MKLSLPTSIHPSIHQSIMIECFHSFIHPVTNTFSHSLSQVFSDVFIHSFIYLFTSANIIFLINNELSSYGSYQDTRLTATRRYSHFYLHYFTHRCPFILRHKVHTNFELSREAVRKSLHIISDQNNIIMCPHHRILSLKLQYFFTI